MVATQNRVRNVKGVLHVRRIGLAVGALAFCIILCSVLGCSREARKESAAPSSSPPAAKAAPGPTVPAQTARAKPSPAGPEAWFSKLSGPEVTEERMQRFLKVLPKFTAWLKEKEKSLGKGSPQDYLTASRGVAASKELQAKLKQWGMPAQEFFPTLAKAFSVWAAEAVEKGKAASKTSLGEAQAALKKAGVPEKVKEQLSGAQKQLVESQAELRKLKEELKPLTEKEKAVIKKHLSELESVLHKTQ